MKKDKIIFWTITGLFSLFMALGAIPDILMIDDAKEVAKHLGYPMYLLPFLGVAKTFGAITILIPRFNKLKEWAYAGLSINLIGATYSIIQVDGFSNILIPLFGILLLTVSYIFWGKIKANNDKV
ncbi:DoxX family protein [Parapedobacter tibetensis]|uniref:DoxX family protein n=1 Tax=Parapedobacter tibetensis TaxID=2972951 RepID=UPI00214DAF62|nr:DoxX family protein [Parapedobacter tibetensis]